ncbi:hypothetical protein BD413DRAFT_492139 [Trametes elegans]|nr:hypothetical protein BD413DRAFT_492139 [Trametes elegans]
MYSQKRQQRSELLAIVAVIVLLAVNLVHKLVSLSHLCHAPADDPINGGVWEVERAPVAFQFDLGLHYGFNASDAWGALVPGDGLVRLGPHREPFAVSMLHQLRCLDIMREQLTLPLAARAEQPARHCMNYIRQMILCRGDTHLDPYQYPSNIRPLDANPIRRCLDWRAVYTAVEDNQREYAEWAAAAARQ